MKFRSYNEEMFIAQSLLSSQFNNIVIDRRYRDHSPSGGGKSVIKDTFSIPCIFGARDTIIKELENEAGTIKLPLIILTSTAIRTDPSRNVDINIDMIYQVDSKYDLNKKRGLPVNIDYDLTIVARYREDMEQIITNFIVHYKPDTYMKWRHPKNNSQILESQIVWNQQFQLDDVTETKSTSQVRHKAKTQFTFKTWIFPGMDQYDTSKVNGNSGIIETINYYGDDFVNYPEVGNSAFRQNKFWVVNQNMEIDQMRYNIINGLVTDPCNHDDFAGQDTWNTDDNGFSKMIKNTLVVSNKGDRIGSVATKLINLGKDQLDSSSGTSKTFQFENKINEVKTQYNSSSVTYKPETKILTMINTTTVGSLTISSYFQGVGNQRSCVGLSINHSDITDSYLYQLNFGVDFTPLGYSHTPNNKIYPTSSVDFNNNVDLLTKVHNTLSNYVDGLEFKQYSIDYKLIIPNEGIANLVKDGLDQSEINDIVTFYKINVGDNFICLMNRYYYFVLDSTKMNNDDCKPEIYGPVLDPSLKNPTAFYINGQYIGFNTTFSL